MVDWTALTSEVKFEVGITWEVGSFETCGFFFPGFAEFFFEDELIVPIIPSTVGVGGALEVPGLGASGK